MLTKRTKIEKYTDSGPELQTFCKFSNIRIILTPYQNLKMV